MNKINIIREILEEREFHSIDNSQLSYIHAAVLMPIFRDEHGYSVLFTKRTNKVEHHKGQISFPGGAVEEQDQSLVETALRESHEEIGLSMEDVDLLGRIDDTLTDVSSFIVHPFVGQVPYPYDFKINTQEVEQLIMVPLDIFLYDPSPYKKDQATFGSYTYRGASYYYNDHIIWGATARIMENFINIVGERLRLSKGGN